MTKEQLYHVVYWHVGTVARPKIAARLLFNRKLPKCEADRWVEMYRDADQAGDYGYTAIEAK